MNKEGNIGIKEGKIGPQEATWLVTIVISNKVFFSSPAVLATLVGNSYWYQVIISALVAWIFFQFICLLLKDFPNKSLVEIFHIVLGNKIGLLFTLCLGIFLFYSTIIRLEEFSEFMRVYILPLSPNWYINAIFIICTMFAAWFGLESLARISKILILSFIAGLLAIFLLGIQHYNVNNLFPLMGYGLNKTVLQGISRCSSFGEVIILAIFAPSLHGAEHIKKEGKMSLFYSLLIVFSTLLAINLTYPYYILQEITAATFELTTLINYGQFLQRLELLFVYSWILGCFISVSILFYSVIWIYCWLFNISDKRPVVIGLSLVLYAASLLLKDIISIIYIWVPSLRYIGFIPLFILPLITLVVAKVRGLGKEAARHG